ncbi:helix-turn-helix domain-containing protein [Streptomyces mirabilis]|uniref:helix-turn-helix domain-containing protein n=1 Tax=Streptomyces mirabilis TaxID=68239 RepID=UPI00363BCD87
MAANLVRLRKERGLSTTRLSAALEGLGQPIPATGITRIEKGQRRVDADDLVALALALNVAPITLLLPPSSSDEQAHLTANQHVTSRTAWQWGAGQGPAMDWVPGEAVSLAEPGADPAIAAEAYEREQEYGRQRSEYLAQAMPPELRRSAEQPSVRLARQLADLVEDLVSVEAGTDPSAAAARVRMAVRRHQQLGIELEELQERFDPRPVVHPGVGFEQFRERLAAEGGIEDQTSKDEPGGE